MKLSELGKQSVLRNPRLFGILYRMDLVEHIGSGLKRIRDSRKETGLEEPIIEADEHWFQVTFKRKKIEKSSVETKPDSKVKTSMKILDLMKADPAIIRIQIVNSLAFYTRATVICTNLKQNNLKRNLSDW